MQRGVGVAMAGCEYQKWWESLEATPEAALENTSAMVGVTSRCSIYPNRQTLSKNESSKSDHLDPKPQKYH